jgi:hypothetical protein
MRDELDAATRLDRLVPIHEHLSQIAAADRYRVVFERCGLANHVNAISASPAYGPLLAALRDAEFRGADIDTLLHQALRHGTLNTARDIAAVLHERIDRIKRRAELRGHLRPRNRIAGLVTPADQNADSHLAAPLGEIEALITERAHELARDATQHSPSWIAALGPEPADELAHALWQETVIQFAAYRERYGILSDDALGPQPSSKNHSQHQAWLRLRDLAAQPRADHEQADTVRSVDTATDHTVEVGPGDQRLA